MITTLQAELAGMDSAAKTELAGLLFEDLSKNHAGLIRLDGVHGPLYVYRPPENGREYARRMAESLTAEERAELLRKSRKQSPGLTFEEVENLISDLTETPTAIPK